MNDVNPFQRGNHLLDRFSQFVEVDLLLRGNRERPIADLILDPVQQIGQRIVQCVDLVDHRQRRSPIDAQVSERALHALDLFQHIRRGAIDNMQQQIGLFQLLQRRPEGRDQLCRQLLDEADRVGEQDGVAL